MSFPTDDEFTRNLNDRIKELEDMTNEINEQTIELNEQASKGEETTEINQAVDSRTEGDTIFFTATIDSSKPLKLNITNNNGDIEVYGSEIDHIEIMATRQSGEVVDHSHWFFQQVENEIALRPNWQVASRMGDLANKLKDQLKEGFKTSDWSSRDFKFGMDINYDIVVRMPQSLAADSKVSLKTANGDIQAERIDAELDSKTANGDVHVESVSNNLTINSANGALQAQGVTGNAHASTANGDISLEGVTGSIEANTANGDVSVNGGTGWMAIRTANGDAQLENVTARGGRFTTVAGDITFDGVLSNAADYSFDSVTGDVSVKARIPAEGATFNGKTLSGEISATGEWTKQDKRNWVVGEGNGPRISAKTVSSDIHMHAIVDESVVLEHEPAASAEESGSEREDHGSSSSNKDNDININLDFEIERAKGWIKDMGTKLGAFMGETSGSGDSAKVVDPVAPQAPEAPKAPEAPVDVEQKAATAERRAKLLEAVKNGEMTVDEALAELEREA